MYDPTISLCLTLIGQGILGTLYSVDIYTYSFIILIYFYWYSASMSGSDGYCFDVGQCQSAENSSWISDPVQVSRNCRHSISIRNGVSSLLTTTLFNFYRGTFLSCCHSLILFEEDLIYFFFNLNYFSGEWLLAWYPCPSSYRLWPLSYLS